jgi:hypothetical protein
MTPGVAHGWAVMTLHLHLPKGGGGLHSQRAYAQNRYSVCVGGGRRVPPAPFRGGRLTGRASQWRGWDGRHRTGGAESRGGSSCR